MSSRINPFDHRRPDHMIEPWIVQRWSSRALNAQPVSQPDLDSLFEAARWAPSARNEQEWRFLYSHRNTETWATFFELLMEANQVWCQRAGALVVVLSQKVFIRDGSPNTSHSFDAGLATQNLLLQAASMGLVAHPMVGFDSKKTQADLKIPDTFQVELMIAVGHPGDPANLPEAVRQRELPSGRKAVSEISKEGFFSF